MVLVLEVVSFDFVMVEVGRTTVEFDWHFPNSYEHYLSVQIVNVCRSFHRHDRTKSCKRILNRIVIGEKKTHTHTLTTRFFKCLFNSPLACSSSRLNRRLLSTLTCSFLRNAKLDRRVFVWGKSKADERRRNAERGSGCLNKHTN